MKVVVTGANSAVGQAVLRCGSPQASTPVTFVAAVRSQRAADQIRSQLSSPNEVIRISYEDPGILDAAFDGAFAVIHLPGILFERPDSTYEQANVASTRSVVESTKRVSLRKIVLVSATGADEASRNRYYRTKGEAEALVRASGVPYTVLRAPLLLGPSTAGAAALQRNISGGKTKLIGGGRHLQQPLHVDDLARAALASATQELVARNLTLDLVRPALHCRSASSWREPPACSAGTFASARFRRICSPWCWPFARRIGKPGFSRDVLEVITADTHLDPQPAACKLGIQLTGIDEMIQASLGSA